MERKTVSLNSRVDKNDAGRETRGKEYEKKRQEPACDMVQSGKRETFHESPVTGVVGLWDLGVRNIARERYRRNRREKDKWSKE